MEFTKYGITETPKLIYNNPLASKSDIDGFVLEGTANISFPEGKLRMENGLSAAQVRRQTTFYGVRRIFHPMFTLNGSFSH